MKTQILACSLLIFACCLPAAAQQYSIDWYKVAGGGGTSTNGTYSLSGTIGQPDASGAMSGGNYSVTPYSEGQIRVVLPSESRYRNEVRVRSVSSEVARMGWVTSS